MIIRHIHRAIRFTVDSWPAVRTFQEAHARLLEAQIHLSSALARAQSLKGSFGVELEDTLKFIYKMFVL